MFALCNRWFNWHQRHDSTSLSFRFSSIMLGLSVTSCRPLFFIVNILFGNDYIAATSSLRVFAFVPLFAYLGTARNIYVVSLNKQKYLKYVFLFGALINIALDFLLINWMGIVGAAIATLLAQIFTAIIIPLFIGPLRKNSLYIFSGIFMKW